MKKILKLLCASLIIIAVTGFVVSCNNDRGQSREEIKLATAMLGEVEFENGDGVWLSQSQNEVIVGGTIEKMSDSQKFAFGKNGIEYAVSLKFVFDKERTISSFEIKGEQTKVFSTDETEQNYAGKLTDLLDNESGEDAYCFLILSAETNEYELTSKYSDGTVSIVKLKINATLKQDN